MKMDISVSMINNRYPLTPKAKLNDYVGLFGLVPMVIFLSLTGPLLYRGIKDQHDGILRLVFAIPLMVLISLLTLLCALGIIVAVGRPLLSYLKTTTDGIEYRFWPLHKVIGKWEDVDRIAKVSISPFSSSKGDILILRKADVGGFHMIFNPQNKRASLRKTSPVIPLYNFEGWPDGELGNDIRSHLMTFNEKNN